MSAHLERPGTLDPGDPSIPSDIAHYLEGGKVLRTMNLLTPLTGP